VRVLANELGLRDVKFNIVLMGMGEPLHNYDNTMKALRMLNDERGLAISPKRVTCRRSACCRHSNGWPPNR
jgi:23S rRNA (adenine2503-C2)-methyltransferase